MKKSFLEELKLKLNIVKEKDAVRLNKYMNENGLCTYLDSDKSILYQYGKYKCNFIKMNDYKVLHVNSVEYFEITNQINNGLYKIEDNIEAINNMLDHILPFTLYEEYYEVKKGKCYTLNWTDNYDSRFLTGNKMLCYPLFYGYKINYEDNLCIKSENVEDLKNLPDEFKYIKKNFYKYNKMEYNSELNVEEVARLTRKKHN